VFKTLLYQQATRHQTWGVIELAVHVLSEAEGKNLHLCLKDFLFTIIMTVLSAFTKVLMIVILRSVLCDEGSQPSHEGDH
jgi:hypothetical protein